MCVCVCIYIRVCEIQKRKKVRNKEEVGDDHDT